MSKAFKLATGDLDNVQSLNDAPWRGLKNVLINGGFEISQRTGPFTTQNYTVDRWAANFGGGAATLTQQTFVAGHTETPGNAKNYLEFNLTSTGGGTAHIEQRVEDVRRLSGKKVTLTFYARCSSAITLYAKINQNFGSGGSSTVTCVDQSFSGATSFTKHQVVFTMPSISGKTLGTDHFVQLFLYFSAGATVTIDFARVSLMEGDLSNEDDPFEERPETLELLLCQRYGYKVKNNGVNSLYGVIALAYTSIRAFAQITMPVTPRAIPSITNTSSALHSATLSSSVTTTSLGAFQTAGNIVCLDIGVPSSLVAGDAYHFNLIDIFLDMEL